MFVPCCPSLRHQGQTPAIEPGDVVQASPLIAGSHAGVAPALVVTTSTTGGADPEQRTRRHLLWFFTEDEAPVLGQSLQTVPICEVRRVGGPQVLGADARAHLARVVRESQCHQGPAILAALA